MPRNMERRSNPKNDRVHSETLRRAQEVAKYRIEEGLSFRQIGAKMGVTHQTCSRLFRTWMDQLAEETRDLMDVAREVELRRLDKLWDTAYRDSKAAEPEDRARAINASLRIMERRAKLLGLDAPQQHELFGKDGGPIDMKTTFDLSGLEGEALDKELEGFFHPGHVEAARPHTSGRKRRTAKGKATTAKKQVAKKSPKTTGKPKEQKGKRAVKREGPVPEPPPVQGRARVGRSAGPPPGSAGRARV